MSRILTILVCLSALFTFRPTARAETLPAVMGVTISCACPDSTGQAYVAALKNAIAKDSHFRQMGLDEGFRKGAIRIHIISMELESSDGKPRAALSIVYTHDGVLMHQFIETCTRIPISDCAQAALKDLKELEG